MQFTRFLIALVAPVLVLAQTPAPAPASGNPNPFNVPAGGYATEAGKTVDLKWTPTTQGTVTLYLRSGNSAALDKGVAIASKISNSGSYTWSVPQDVVNGGSYAIEIVDDSNPSATNYTPQFPIRSNNQSSAAPTTGSTTSSAATTSSTGSSSSNTASTNSSSKTASTTNSSTRPTNTQSQGIQTPSGTGNAAARVTGMAGVVGALALGVLAL